MKSSLQCFGVGIKASNEWLKQVQAIAVHRSITRLVSRMDIFRDALDRAIAPTEWQQAREIQRERENRTNTEPLRSIKVRGDDSYHELLLIIASMRGLTAGELVKQAIRDVYGVTGE